MTNQPKSSGEISVQSLKDQAIAFYSESMEKTNSTIQGDIDYFKHGISKIQVSVKWGQAEFSFLISGPDCACKNDNNAELDS